MATKKKVTKAKVARAAAVLEVDPRQSCHLLCFDEERPTADVRAAVLRVLSLLRQEHPGGAPWLVFAGTSPMHWRGLTQWVLVSEPLPNGFFEVLCGVLRGRSDLGDLESTELTQPTNEPFVVPLFSVQDDGARFLVAPELVSPSWSTTLGGVEIRQRGWTWRAPKR